ncbi:alpha/beta fold hydrolase [Acaryochloris sp. IP29b_bin.148]|uniref:alpha/beta fold hydrolase n=1 Tax=Acaryochloris sp. IP29b_bin.148 TaxID=2969218 RepID=UPI00260CD018|nr:alpha/beta fold hydrolase [Acaryochloris sp. IP29b_bin.148]
MTPNSPSVLLFVQHGWADTNGAMARLAQRIAPPRTRIIAPNLGWWRTWWRIDPLVEDVEAIAHQTIAQYPHTPIRIVGHSMGGLIWLEVLHRHPEWWLQVESLVLVGSPVSGSDLCRLMDPLALGLGMARDLGKNRREIASAIAAQIPTLSIASNTDGGSDGLVMLGATQFDHAHHVVLPDILHSAQRHDQAIDLAIQAFWQSPRSPLPVQPSPELDIIQRLRTVPGMTDAHSRDFDKAKVALIFDSGLSLRRWKNPVRVDHVFLASPQSHCLYSGFVGWIHAAALRRTLQDIQQDYSASKAP